jgi:hypothetical protein
VAAKLLNLLIRYSSSQFRRQIISLGIFLDIGSVLPLIHNFLFSDGVPKKPLVKNDEVNSAMYSNCLIILIEIIYMLVEGSYFGVYEMLKTGLISYLLNVLVVPFSDDSPLLVLYNIIFPIIAQVCQYIPYIKILVDLRVIVVLNDLFKIHIEKITNQISVDIVHHICGILFIITSLISCRNLFNELQIPEKIETLFSLIVVKNPQVDKLLEILILSGVILMRSLIKTQLSQKHKPILLLLNKLRLDSDSFEPSNDDDDVYWDSVVTPVWNKLIEPESFLDL